MTDTAKGLLGGWYGDPLDEAAARELLARAEARARDRARRGVSCRTCRLQRLAALFWLGRPYESELGALRSETRRSARGRALAHLVHGQLLMSRRMPDAAGHLRKGFEAAARLFTAPDYFTVLKRHRLLAHLPPLRKPATAAALDDLLTAAAVARRLGGGAQRPVLRDPDDTHG